MRTMVQFRMDFSGQDVVVECKLPILNPLLDAGAFPGQPLSPSFLFPLHTISRMWVELKTSLFQHGTELAIGYIGFWKSSHEAL